MVTWHHNEWYPDTCGCGLQFVFDEDLPENARHNIFFAKLQPCPEHPDLEGHELYDIVVSENTSIQKIRTYAIDNIPELQQTITNDDGSSFIDLKKSIRLEQSWSGKDKNRKVSISFNGSNLTNQQKKLIQDFSETLLGIGKVSIT